MCVYWPCCSHTEADLISLIEVELQGYSSLPPPCLRLVTNDHDVCKPPRLQPTSRLFPPCVTASISCLWNEVLVMAEVMGGKFTADVRLVDAILWRLSTFFFPLCCVGTRIVHVIHSSHFDFSPSPSPPPLSTACRRDGTLRPGFVMPHVCLRACHRKPSIVVCHWCGDCKALWWSLLQPSARLFSPCTRQPCAAPWSACCRRGRRGRRGCYWLLPLFVSVPYLCGPWGTYALSMCPSADPEMSGTPSP